MANKPNVLFIMGDDIGITNLSCYSDGMMGYRTPNIDRIADEGIRFTDYYGEQSCTAGRAAFVTGQNPYRSGLTKVGYPGSEFGIMDGTVTIGFAFKEHGYRTGQFGKNHFGDRDHHLPTNHGFDEFFGVLYHLNSMQEPEDPDYPNAANGYPDFLKKHGPRGVIHSKAGGEIVDTGQLTIERMKTIDDEVGEHSKQFIRDAVAADEPFFVYHNTTHMHFRTHTKEESKGQSGRWQSNYHDTMIDHDQNIGDLLDLLDELGVADNTIVVYTTDNGPHANTWPDGATTPFRSEKETNWEGAFRVPCVVRWPGHYQAGKVLNGIVSHDDWFVTLMAAIGDDDIADRLQKGATLAGQEFRAHLDGHDMNAYFSGETDESPRNYFFYVTDDGDICGLRFDNWKCVFMEQPLRGTYAVWVHKMETLHMPMLFNLRTDPFERADITSNTYWDWFNFKQFALVPMRMFVAEHIKTFADFPAQQSPSSFNLKDVLAKLSEVHGS
ncbi:MAG: arylsulfatase [Caldilineaceae bacterium]|nr:arylsulfatase [Caldilineaceae bacterium]